MESVPDVQKGKEKSERETYRTISLTRQNSFCPSSPPAESPNADDPAVIEAEAAPSDEVGLGTQRRTNPSVRERSNDASGKGGREGKGGRDKSRSSPSPADARSSSAENKDEGLISLGSRR